MKYLADCDLIVEDLHSGDPHDVKMALKALQKHKFEEEKVLILISSLMAWKGTPNKLEEIKSKEVLEAERKLAAAEAARRAQMEGNEDKGDDDEDKKSKEEEPEEDEGDMDGEEDGVEESSIGEF